ncbi:MAG: hypothetical protein ACRC3B_12085, partial [Bacteroidia bacterium]
KSGKETSPEALAGWCLLHKPSFRLPSTAAGDKFLAFRVFRRLSVAAENTAAEKIANGKPGMAAFDNLASVKEIRLRHIEQNTGQRPAVYINRSSLLNGQIGFTEKLSAVFMLLRILLLKGPRVNCALLLREAFEAAALLKLLMQNKITALHFYTAFEKDSNALTLLLRNYGITVNKIPSPSLLAVHHREIITDALSLGSPYQFDELEVFKSTQYITTVNHWTPEVWPVYGKRYETQPAAPAQTIGFYSHATWLREQEGNADTGFGDHNAEKELIPALASYLRKHPEIQLILFLHPRERKPETIERTTAHYNKCFDGINYRFSEKAERSTEQFDSADVGIGGISTILFERLFAGYKTIFYPAGIKLFPVSGSALSRICPVQPAELEIALDEALKHPTAEYFGVTGLSRYTKNEWLKNSQTTKHAG